MNWSINSIISFWEYEQYLFFSLVKTIWIYRKIINTIISSIIQLTSRNPSSLYSYSYNKSWIRRFSNDFGIILSLDEIIVGLIEYFSIFENKIFPRHARDRSRCFFSKITQERGNAVCSRYPFIWDDSRWKVERVGQFCDRVARERGRESVCYRFIGSVALGRRSTRQLVARTRITVSCRL